MENYNLSTINLNTLPEAGLKLESELGVKSLNERIKPEDGEAEIVFKKKPKCKLELKALGKTENFDLLAKLDFYYEQKCGRCSDFKECHVTKKINTLIKKRNSENENEDDDVGVIFYEEDELNLEDILQEEIVLSLSPFLIPETDKEDKCKICKKKIEFPNEGVSQKLGDLLKKL